MSTPNPLGNARGSAASAPLRSDYQRAIIATRMGDLKINPSLTLDAEHLRAVNRRLVSDISVHAGRLNGRDEPEIQERVSAVAASVMQRRVDGERFVRAMADGYRDIAQVALFEAGRHKTVSTFMSQLAQKAGFDVDYTRMTPKQEQNVLLLFQQQKDGGRVSDDVMAGLQRATRDITRRGEPASRTFYVEDLQTINRYLARGVSTRAGMLNNGDETEIEKRVFTAVAGVMQQRGEKERFVHAMADGYRDLVQVARFETAPHETVATFMSQVARHAGYEVDYAQPDFWRWQNHLQRRDRGNMGEDAMVGLRAITRTSAQTLQAVYFAEALQTGDYTAALEKSPPLARLLQRAQGSSVLQSQVLSGLNGGASAKDILNNLPALPVSRARSMER